MTQAQMRDTRDALKFTRMCKYWKVNRCHLGAECNFAHDEGELRDQPDLVSTQLCFQFARKGFCKNGEACTFAHGKGELRRLAKAGKSGHAAPDHKKVSKRHGSDNRPANSTMGCVGKLLSATALEADPKLTLTMATAALTFRPPPGLESSGDASPISPPPGLPMFVVAEPQLPSAFGVTLRDGLESSHRKLLLKQSSNDGLAHELPLRLDATVLAKRDADVGTESASTAWLSGYSSDSSEPSSPKQGPFWL
ncbi:Zfp36 [Symbiodinium natans]|uniref:Zfp36 protein n=1 Tax=Symbiodinium natans TaxID=878477 RepID=A0A812TBN6_9DINO|nr:Zfp36 [Symbiodinium natans]